MDSYDPELKTQLDIINNEIQGWKQTAYIFGLRARIAMKVGDKEDAERNKAEMEKAYRRVDAYAEMLDQVTKEMADTTLKIDAAT